MQLGLFGGSFNPIHNGHVDMARRAKSQFDLDSVVFMVAGDPPHKTLSGNVPAEARFAMVQAALLGEEGLSASRLELARPGKSYTVDTVRAVLAEMPGVELSLIIGEDMLLNLPSWREVETLLRLVRVLVIARPGISGDPEDAAQVLRKRYNARIEIAPFLGKDISSTHVRTCLHEARPISGLVPPGVERLVYENAFYQEEAFAQKQEKLRAMLNKRRYEHSIGTMRCAISLAARWGVDGKAARLAGLLHDCAKLPPERLVQLAAQYGLEPDAYEKENPGLMHDRLGACLARDVYGVQEEAVLEAIRSHTYGKPDMTPLDEIIFLADKIEPTRDYPGVDTLRVLAETGLESAVLACMERVHAHLLEEKRPIKPEGEAARVAFRNRIEAQKRAGARTDIEPDQKMEVES